MINKPSRAAARKKRHYRIRNHVKGTAMRPRLAVFRSNKHMYAQIIDDVAHHTLVAASTMESEIASTLEHTDTVAAAAAVGEAIAKKAVEKVSQKLYSTVAVSFTTAKSKPWRKQQEKPV